MIFEKDFIVFIYNNYLHIVDLRGKEKERDNCVKALKSISCDPSPFDFVNEIKKQSGIPQNIKNRFLTNAGIVLTDLCQLRCNYCSYDSGQSIDSLSFNQAKMFIDYIYQNIVIKEYFGIPTNDNHIYFAGGGEPTAHWDLFVKTVDYIKKLNQSLKNKIKIYMTSNGFLNDSQLKYVIANVDSTLVSFDGTEFLQNKNRKTSNLMSSYSIVDKTLREMNRQKYPFSIRSTFWPDDLKSLRDAADFIFGNYGNINKWEFEVVAELGRACKSDVFNSSTDYSALSVDFINYYEDLFNYISEKYPQKAFSNSVANSKLKRFNCGTIYGKYIWLRANGEIVTCIDAHDDATILGYIKDKIEFYSFNDQLTEQYLKTIRTTCFDCLAQYYCGYGCPVRNKTFSVGSKWLCNSKKMFYKKAFNCILENHSYLNLFGEKTTIDALGEFDVYKVQIKKGEKNEKKQQSKD